MQHCGRQRLSDSAHRKSVSLKIELAFADSARLWFFRAPQPRSPQEQAHVTSRSIRSMLAGGDRRSIGLAGDVARIVQAAPELLGEVLAAMSDEVPVARMRASGAAGG